MAFCKSCSENKPDEDFYLLRSNRYHAVDKTWRSNRCKKCTNKRDHQRTLEKLMLKGVAIVNCDKCDMLMKKMTTRTVCLGCR